MRAEGGRLRLIVHGTDGPDLDDRLAAFETICTKRRGLRVERRGEEVLASFDPTRSEQVGPLIEAVATANGLRLTLADLDAEIRSAGLEAAPSRVWAAIGNAADEGEVTRTRGEASTGDLFRYVRVDDLDGVRTALDDRPPMVEPTGGGPVDSGPTKYDDIDYHDGAAEAAGQPREHAFTHIGLYLAWLIRHGLHDHRAFPREHTAAVKRREMTGSDLADVTDGKLLSDHMSALGAAFSDARYETYLAEYAALFKDESDYGVPDDPATYAQVQPVIDRLYADWIVAGSPGPEPKAPSPLDAHVEDMREPAAIPWDELPAGTAVELKADGSYVVSQPDVPHADPGLEAIVPSDIVGPPIELSSVTATNWGPSLLSRALKELGVRPRDVTIVNGLAGSGDRTFGLTLYRVPGASADRLASAFASAIHRPRKTAWEIRRVGETDVWWAEGYADPYREFYFTVAYWTRDGLVLQVNGHREDMEAAIRRLG